MTYSNEQLKKAVTGTNDYHDFMRSITVVSLKKQAGFIPENTGKIDTVYKNPENWKSRKMHMGAGMLWIFFAVEYGHYSTGEAVVIWRYGQALRFIDLYKIRLPQLQGNEKVCRVIENAIKNPYMFTDGDGELEHGLNDEFSINQIVRISRLDRENFYIWDNGDIGINGDIYDTIVRIFDNLILWIYTGSQHFNKKDIAELYNFMGW